MKRNLSVGVLIVSLAIVNVFAQFEDPGGYFDAALKEVRRRNERFAREEQERLEAERPLRESQNRLQRAVLEKVQAAGGFEAILQSSRWEVDGQWFEAKRRGGYTKSTRPSSMLACPFATFLCMEFKVDKQCDRLEYWWSRNAYLEVSGVKLPFVGKVHNGQLQWLTEIDGSESHWGWDNPERGKVYHVWLVFAGSIPPNSGFISLCEDRSGNSATGYTWDNRKISPPDKNRTYSTITEPQLRGKLLSIKDPIAGIYENASKHSMRLGVYRNDNGQYTVVHLGSNGFSWWKEGEVKASLFPTATQGIFKADWTDEVFYKNTTALVSFNGTTMKALGNELPLENGCEEITFLKTFPTESDMVAAALTGDLSEVFSKFPQWTATNNWYHNESSCESIRANGLIIGPRVTVLFVELQVDADRDFLQFFASKNAYLKVGDVRMPFIGHWTNNERLQININADGSVYKWGWNNPKKGTSYIYNMVFDGKFPLDISPGTYIPVSLEDGVGNVHGYSLRDILISPPGQGRRMSGISEAGLRRKLYNSEDPITGIYEDVGPNCLRLGVFRDDNGRYSVIYLVNGKHRWWQEGEIKATLHPTATRGIFKAEWIDASFLENKTALVTFDGAMMRVVGNEMLLECGEKEMTFLKMWPSEDEIDDVGIGDGNSNTSVSGGTGFALKNGYLITNHHVIDGATDIRVLRNGKNGEEEGKGKVVCVDKKLDLAVIKTAFDNSDPPYSIYQWEVEAGEAVFALGYPLVSTMGKEMKLTTGVVSSTRGFQDSPDLYQISAAVQPGNSGGPLFSERGSALVGVVSAKHLGAENANYAIKSSRLVQFLKLNDLEHAIPSSRALFKKGLNQRVKTLREFVYRLECACGGKRGDDSVRTFWYPNVREPYYAGTIRELVVIRVIMRSDATIVEIGGKGLFNAWLRRETQLSVFGKNAQGAKINLNLKLTKVEGLPNDEPHDEPPMRADLDKMLSFKTFKAYFEPLPANCGIDSIDFLEPHRDPDDGAFIIKGISISAE